MVAAGCNDSKPAPVQLIGPSPDGQKVAAIGTHRREERDGFAQEREEWRRGGDDWPHRWRRESRYERIAGFMVADCSLVPCNERPDDPCETPWDYCCGRQRDEGLASVKFVDEGGKVIGTDARTLLGFKELDTVVEGEGRTRRQSQIHRSGYERVPPARQEEMIEQPMSAQVDLRQLAVQREPAKPSVGFAEPH